MQTFPHLRAVLGKGFAHDFRRGDIVLKAGTSPAPVMLLTSGWLMRVRLRADGQIANMGTFLNDDPVGLEHVTLPRCGDDYVALTAGTVRITAVEAFANGNGDRADMLADIVTAQAYEQHYLRQALAAVGGATAHDRLLIFLFQTRERMIAKGMCERSGDAAIFPLTQVDLGMTIGVTPIHVNRVMKTLRDAGLCSLLHQRLTVIDETAFGAAARRAMGLTSAGP